MHHLVSRACLSRSSRGTYKLHCTSNNGCNNKFTYFYEKLSSIVSYNLRIKKFLNIFVRCKGNYWWLLYLEIAKVTINRTVRATEIVGVGALSMKIYRYQPVSPDTRRSKNPINLLYGPYITNNCR